MSDLRHASLRAPLLEYGRVGRHARRVRADPGGMEAGKSLSGPAVTGPASQPSRTALPVRQLATQAYGTTKPKDSFRMIECAERLQSGNMSSVARYSRGSSSMHAQNGSYSAGAVAPLHVTQWQVRIHELSVRLESRWRRGETLGSDRDLELFQQEWRNTRIDFERALESHL